MKAQEAGKLRHDSRGAAGNCSETSRRCACDNCLEMDDRVTTTRSSAAGQSTRDKRRAAPAEQLPSAVYAELRRIAERFMRGEAPGHTLQPTALVNEAFLRLAGRQGVVASSPTHMRALFAQAMRRILVDHARRKAARKRGGERVRVALDERLLSASTEEDLLDLDATLAKLAQLDPAQEQLVELRIFGGMTVSEAAVEMGISKRTAEREWTAARAWLRRELAPADAHDS
jgi:RNA polymerase sigma-70 factor (ECF subfamily)